MTQAEKEQIEALKRSIEDTSNSHKEAQKAADLVAQKTRDTPGMQQAYNIVLKMRKAQASGKSATYLMGLYNDLVKLQTEAARHGS
jgi:hypothetical protein